MDFAQNKPRIDLGNRITAPHASVAVQDAKKEDASVGSYQTELDAYMSEKVGQAESFAELYQPTEEDLFEAASAKEHDSVHLVTEAQGYRQCLAIRLSRQASSAYGMEDCNQN